MPSEIIGMRADNVRRAKCGLLLIAVCLASISCREATRIHTFPPGARVWVNGRYLGEAPVKFSVKSWSVRRNAYHYRAEKPGYLTKDGYLEPHLSISRIVAASTSSCITCFHGFYVFDEETEIVLQQDPLARPTGCPPCPTPTR